jgi:hypothetical protein
VIYHHKSTVFFCCKMEATNSQRAGADSRTHWNTGGWVKLLDAEHLAKVQKDCGRKQKI